MLQAIREKLRPVLFRAWKKSRAAAEQQAQAHGMSQREHALYLAGFQNGWVAGALDATIVSPTDLPSSDQGPPSEVH